MLIPLPIDNVLPDLLDHFRNERNLVLTAAPGAGKTTRVAPFLVRQGVVNGQVIMLQPRRVAARSSAKRIADEQKWELGNEVGYQVRYENRTSPRTKVRVVTEGILTQIIRNDPFLDGIDCVILDEFHERNLHGDLAIAMCREIQESVRPDLKILVMSATINAKAVSYYLGNASIIHAEGRAFPIEKHYLPGNDSRSISERMSDVINKVTSSKNKILSGHILCFLPGMREIRRVADALALSPEDEIHMLHSSVSAEDQDKALALSSKRKIILATNIAETSITVDGVGTVIDSGWTRGMVWNEKLGIPRLETMRESRASMEQRAGRAGRTRAGECYRCWSIREEQSFPDYDIPEIHRSDLSQYVLLLMDYGVSDPYSFGWYEIPYEDRLSGVLRGLSMIGLTENNGLSLIGRLAAGVPLNPRLSLLLVIGKLWGIEKQCITMAAVLNEWESLVRSAGSITDIVHHVLDNFVNESRDNYQLNQAVTQLRKVSQNMDVRGISPVSLPGSISAEDKLRAAMVLCFPDRIAKVREGDRKKGGMVGRKGVVFDNAIPNGIELVICADLRDTENSPEPLVTAYAPVNLNLIEQLLPHLISTFSSAVYDDARGKVMVRKNRCFLDIVLSYHEQGATQADADVVATAILDNLKKRFGTALNILCKNDAVLGLLSRYYFVKNYDEKFDLPDLDFDVILLESCHGVMNPDKVYGDELYHKVVAALDYSDLKKIDLLAPSHFVSAKGKRFLIHYPDISIPENLTKKSESVPYVSAKIQELFGVRETPTVLNGQVKLLVHLLGPNYRPVQVTGDLSGFWKNTYAQVRKELRARYPRHAWPENPYEELPIK